MRSVSLYEYALTNSEDLQLTVGPRSLALSFRWPSVYQEQSDMFERGMKDLARGDPLVGGTTITRDYDWIDFYLEVPEFGAGMEEWWEAQSNKPQSLRTLASSSVYTKLTERKELAAGYNTYREDLSRLLCWSVSITDDLGDKRTGEVRPGGWINNQDNNWSLRFVSDIDTIGYDDIDKVTIEAEVYEFV